MRASLAAAIDAVAPRLPPALVPAAALTAVRDVAAALPATLTNWIDFECRLRDGAAQVDLSVRIARNQARWLERLAARRQAGDVRAWRRIEQIAGIWHRSPGAREAIGIWLEFDIQDGAATLLPRVFIDFARNRWRPRQAVATMAAVLAPHVQSTLLARVQRCLGRLPPGLELRYVGLPAADEIDLIRVCLLARDEQHAIDAVARAAAPADLESVRCMCDRRRRTRGARPSIGAIVHLDVTSREFAASRIGIEFPLERRPQVRGLLADRAFLDALVACGACSAAKRDAIAAWPGCEPAQLPHTFWPGLLLRRVSHVKVVFDREREPEAKAYLCAAHLLRPAIAAVRPPALSAPPPIAP